jgi:hypothetical protein
MGAASPPTRWGVGHPAGSQSELRPGWKGSPERFDGTIRRECIDRLLVFHRVQLGVGEKPLRIGDPEPTGARSGVA